MSAPRHRTDSTLLRTARNTYDLAFDALGLDDDERRLRWSPERTVEVTVALPADGGRGSRAVIAWRTLHSSRRGPGKGGMRFAPSVAGRRSTASLR